MLYFIYCILNMYKILNIKDIIYQIFEIIYIYYIKYIMFLLVDEHPGKSVNLTHVFNHGSHRVEGCPT